MSFARSPRTPWNTARAAWARTPLRTRLVAILLAALLAALALTGWATQFVLRGYLVGQLDASLARNAVPASLTAIDAAQGRLRAGREIPGGLTVTLWIPGTSRPVVVQPRTAVDRPVVTRPAVDQTPEAAAGPTAVVGDVRTTTSADGGVDWRYVDVTIALPSDGSAPTAIVAAVALPLTDVDATVNRLRLLILGLGGIVVVVCALIGWLAIRRSFAPLVEVEETAAAIAAGDLSRRIPARPASTEVGRLTASLNGMLTQIESAFRARAASEARTRRFAADASHELRTPLAAIRGFAELYRQGAVPPDDVGRTMRRIEDEATRMGGLVEDLLLLARLDERRPAKAEPVDLAVLAGDAAHDARGLDAGRQVRLVGLDGGGGPAPAVVVGDEGGLRQVVTNLVGNAVRHTPAGSPIEVAVGVTRGREDGPRAVLEVRDHGPGLPPEEAEHIFERFYRVDSSRRRGTGGGSGLGLSIVAAVTAAHGGGVDVLPTPGGGATFRVSLPAAPPGPEVEDLADSQETVRNTRGTVQRDGLQWSHPTTRG
jgi:two-component system OmpR family sensor kinase